jgi:hypothetical protein
MDECMVYKSRENFMVQGDTVCQEQGDEVQNS